MRSGDPTLDALVDTYDAIDVLAREHLRTCRPAQAIPEPPRFLPSLEHRDVVCLGCHVKLPIPKGRTA